MKFRSSSYRWAIPACSSTQPDKRGLHGVVCVRRPRRPFFPTILRLGFDIPKPHRPGAWAQRGALRSCLDGRRPFYVVTSRVSAAMYENGGMGEARSAERSPLSARFTRYPNGTCGTTRRFMTRKLQFFIPLQGTKKRGHATTVSSRWKPSYRSAPRGRRSSTADEKLKLLKEEADD